MIYTLGEDKINGATSAPFIKIKYLEFDCDLSGVDIIIFTSKKAIVALNETYPSWIEKTIYTVGEKTKKLALSKGAKRVFSPKAESSYDIIQDFKKPIKNKKVLYIRAKKVLRDIKSELSDICDFKEIIVYETIFIKPQFELIKNSVVIFSSPSTIKSFSRFYDFKDFKIVAIGKSTAKYLPKDIKYEMSPFPSLKLCLDKAKTMLAQN